MASTTQTKSSVEKTYNGSVFFAGNSSCKLLCLWGELVQGLFLLNGYGGIQDMAVYNRPALTAVPDGHFTPQAAFAVLHIKGQGVTRLLEGPFPKGKIYDQGLKSRAIAGVGMRACRGSVTAASRANILSGWCTWRIRM